MMLRFGHPSGVGAHRFDDALDRTAGGLVGVLHIRRVAGHLRLILTRANRGGVGEVRGLAGIREEKLVPGAVRLLDVDHDEVGIREPGDCPETHAGLVVDEQAHQVLIDGLELEIGKGSEAGAEALGDPEVWLRRPESHVGVDVVHVGEHGQVARNGVGGVPRDADGGEVGSEVAHVEAGPGLVAAALQEKGARRLVEGPHVGGTRRREAEGSRKDALGHIEEHQGVVVGLAIVGRVRAATWIV
jgi:hypothetical protein